MNGSEFELYCSGSHIQMKGVATHVFCVFLTSQVL